MKYLLVAVLALSLAGNFVGAYFALRPSSVARPGSDARNSDLSESSSIAETVARNTAQPEENALARNPGLWTDLYPANDLAALVTRLRAAGFPPKVVRAMIQQLINDQIAAKTPEEKRPYWARDLSGKTREAQTAANRERQDLLESLLGAEGRPSALLNDSERARRYGGLSDAKIDALVKLERDYDEVMNLVMAERVARPLTAEESRRFGQERELVEREKRAELATLLTSAELAEYERRNSPTAARLTHQLRQIEVNEQEYTALYLLQKSFDEKFPQSTMSAEAYRARQIAQLELNEQVKSVLTGDRFYDYLSSTDSQYNQTKEFTKNYPAITAPDVYAIYRVQQQLQAAALSIGQSQSLTPAQRSEQMRSIATDYGLQLSSLLGPEALEAFKKTPQGRLLNLPAVNPGSGRP